MVPVAKTIGTTSPSWPGFVGPRLATQIKANTKIVTTGKKLTPTTRGAVQFTFPVIDHCIGNLTSSLNEEFALMAMPTARRQKNKLIAGTIIGAP